MIGRSVVHGCFNTFDVDVAVHANASCGRLAHCLLLLPLAILLLECVLSEYTLSSCLHFSLCCFYFCSRVLEWMVMMTTMGMRMRKMFSSRGRHSCYGCVGPRLYAYPRLRNPGLRSKYRLALRSKVGQADSAESALVHCTTSTARAPKGVYCDESVSYAQKLRGERKEK
jgi:hypothetical protein